MTRRREYLDYLEDIVDAGEKIGQFTTGMTFDQFAQDVKTIYAVVRAFVSEKKVSGTFLSI